MNIAFRTLNSVSPQRFQSKSEKSHVETLPDQPK